MMERLNSGRTISGLTLIEVIGALGVMMLLIGIAVPAFLRWLPTFELSAAARQVATDLQLARSKAVSQDLTFQVNFGAGSYVVQKCNPSCTDDSGNKTLPQGITFLAAGTVQFLPRGVASGAASIGLQGGYASSYGQKLVCVNVIGRVKIQNSSCT